MEFVTVSGTRLCCVCVAGEGGCVDRERGSVVGGRNNTELFNGLGSWVMEMGMETW